MHTAEEVRELASAWTEDDHKLHDMLLAYADLLEAMEEIMPGAWGSDVVVALRQRAAEKQKARKG